MEPPGRGEPAPAAGPVRAVLFDLDGTLVDTWHLYLQAYQRALEPVLGRPVTREDFTGIRPTSELGLLLHVAGPDRYGAVRRAFMHHYRELHAELFEGVYAGVLEALEELRRAGLHLGVVTGKSRAAWEVTSAAAGLGRFDVVVTDDDVAEPKPHPDGLLRALDALGLDPGSTVYVGDSVGDLAASRQAGVRFAAALWPKGDHERGGFVDRMEAEGAWRILDAPAALPGALGIGRTGGGGAGPVRSRGG